MAPQWNGYFLDRVATVRRRAAHFFWRTSPTTSRRREGLYEQGITRCAKEKRDLEKRLFRSEKLPWWDIIIQPQAVV